MSKWDDWYKDAVETRRKVLEDHGVGDNFSTMYGENSESMFTRFMSKKDGKIYLFVQTQNHNEMFVQCKKDSDEVMSSGRELIHKFVDELGLKYSKPKGIFGI